MGYDTFIQVYTDADDVTKKRIYKEIEERFDEPYDEYGNPSGPTRWYSCHEDITKLSADFPGVLFTVNGEGEQNGDIWVLYAKDGKSYLQRSNWSADAFDEAKLQELNPEHEEYEQDIWKPLPPQLQPYTVVVKGLTNIFHCHVTAPDAHQAGRQAILELIVKADLVDPGDEDRDDQIERLMPEYKCIAIYASHLENLVK